MAFYTFGATPSTIEPRDYKILDAAIQLRDYSASAVSADTNGNAISFYAEAYDAYKVVVNHAAITGTIDGSNNWAVRVEGDNESTFTSPVTLASVTLTAAASEHSLVLSGQRVSELRIAAGLTSEISLVRIVLDKTGTVGNLTAGAYISPV